MLTEKEAKIVIFLANVDLPDRNVYSVAGKFGLSTSNANNLLQILVSKKYLAKIKGQNTRKNFYMPVINSEINALAEAREVALCEEKTGDSDAVLSGAGAGEADTATDSADQADNQKE